MSLIKITTPVDEQTIRSLHVGGVNLDLSGNATEWLY
jgi:hypothetical protein